MRLVVLEWTVYYHSPYALYAISFVAYFKKHEKKIFSRRAEIHICIHAMSYRRALAVFNDAIYT